LPERSRARPSACNVTQSTLSHQIRQLEEEVGQPLFDRIGRRVVTTEAGALFPRLASRALQEVDQGIATLKPGGGGPDRSGAHRRDAHVSTSAESRSASPSSSLATRRADRVDELSADEISTACTPASSISASPTSAGPTELWFEPLYNEEMVLVRLDLASARRAKRIRMVELHQQRLVLAARLLRDRSLLDECFKASGAEPVVVAEMSTIAPMLGLVHAHAIGAIVAHQRGARGA
jgi:LysR family cyn operon transcriptional activator